jgi:hypothetical protein
MQKNKQVVLDQWNKIKSNVDKFIKENHVDELQTSIKKMVHDAKKDLSKVVDKDVAKVKAKVLKEAQTLEKLLDSTVKKEVHKAKTFLTAQKKEIVGLQKKINSLVKGKKKTSSKSKSKKSSPKTKKSSAK